MSNYERLFYWGAIFAVIASLPFTMAGGCSSKKATPPPTKITYVSGGYPEVYIQTTNGKLERITF